MSISSVLPCKSARALSAGFACCSAFALCRKNISSPLGASLAAASGGGGGWGRAGGGGGKAAPGKFDLRILRELRSLVRVE